MKNSIPKIKNCHVTVTDENYMTLKQFNVSREDAKYVTCDRRLYIVIYALLGLCLLMFFNNKSNRDKIKLLKTENKLLKAEKILSDEKYAEACKQLEEAMKELEYSRWDKKLHNVIGYYSVKPNSKIDKDILYSFLNKHSDVFLYPDIIYAQVVLESSVGKSDLYKRSNNLIGMNYPLSRETTAIGRTNNGFATYKNWQMCVLDRPLWDKIMFRDKLPTRSEYIAKLRQRYAADPKYIERINHIIDTDYNKHHD